MIAAIRYRNYFIAAIIFCSFQSYAQKRGNVWCFGHYASIDFNNVPPVPDSSHTISRGSCTSVCDTSGSLLFYAVDDTVANFAVTINGAKVFSANHQMMQFGDSLNAQAWYNEIIIIPFPSSSSLYYVFTIGVTSFYGLYYSVVDLSLNGGLGTVVQKNIQLQNFPMDDCLTAIKHGNGRDWWLLFRRWNPSGGAGSNEYYTYLITPSGILNFNTQNIGSNHTTGLSNICFNKTGNMFIYTNVRGMIEKYDFDRCTGIISNAVTIFPEQNISGNYVNYYGSAISPNGNVLYVAYSDVTSALLQFDLTAGNIAATEDTLWTQTSPINAAGYMRLAPDDKIYFSCAYVPLTAPMYPYADSLYNMYNMNLSIINSPDSLGAACNFQPYSFYLGGKRTYWGLPNNPDYDMPALSGSLCDSLTGIQNITQDASNAELFVFYHTGWQKASINAQNIKGTKYKLRVYDLLGNLVFNEESKLQPPYFTKDLNCSAFAKGMYVVELQTERERLVKKFVLH